MCVLVEMKGGGAMRARWGLVEKVIAGVIVSLSAAAAVGSITAWRQVSLNSAAASSISERVSLLESVNAQRFADIQKTLGEFKLFMQDGERFSQDEGDRLEERLREADRNLAVRIDAAVLRGDQRWADIEGILRQQSVALAGLGAEIRAEVRSIRELSGLPRVVQPD